MKLPNRRNFGVLMTLAVLLSAMTMGCLGFCDALLHGILIVDGVPIFLSVPAGSSANDIWPIGFLGIFSICESSVVAEGGTAALPTGVCRSSRSPSTVP